MIAGFYEGSEGEGDKKGAIELKGVDKDGLIARIDKREKILGVEDSLKLKDMSNKEIVEAALLSKQGLLPTIKDRRMDRNSLQTQLVLSELRKLRETIDSKPVSNVSLDGLGNIVENMVKSGMTQVIKKKMF